MVLFFCPPDKTPEPVGVVLFDHSERLSVKLKPKLEHDDETTSLVWVGMIENLKEDAGGYQIVRWLEEHGSHVFQLSPRNVVESKNLAQALNNLYQENVA
jgi:hypothetical protein